MAREASHLYGLLAFLEIYLHILKWAGEKLALAGIPAKIIRASVLTNGDVRIAQTNEAIEVSVPPAIRGDMDTVIKLELSRTADGIKPLTECKVKLCETWELRS